MFHWLRLAVCGVVIAATPALAQETHFDSEQAAQQHCPRDTVVWVNTNSGVYHFKGQRWYGNTRSGAYECRKEANAEGDRAMRNGQ